MYDDNDVVQGVWLALVVALGRVKLILVEKRREEELDDPPTDVL